MVSIQMRCPQAIPVLTSHISFTPFSFAYDLLLCDRTAHIPLVTEKRYTTYGESVVSNEGVSARLHFQRRGEDSGKAIS